MKKYTKGEQRILAGWAIHCAERVLPYFEEFAPNDIRPRRALEIGKNWIQNGIFKMAEIRGASLGSHKAAGDVKEHLAAFYAARSAGQAVATAHVPQHAYGGAYYALKAILAAHPTDTEKAILDEYKWQQNALPKKMRKAVMSRIIVKSSKKGKITVSIDKTGDF